MTIETRARWVPKMLVRLTKNLNETGVRLRTDSSLKWPQVVFSDLRSDRAYQPVIAYLVGAFCIG